MKKFLSLTLLVFLSLSLQLGFAQGAKDEVPLDPSIKTGKLSNGMTYFIKQNKRPEKRMELRLAVGVGSVDEDEDQKGLAHFVEHMCFNGTKNFPKNDLVNFLEKTGVKFGAHLNAYTSFEETVYMLQLPTDDNKIMKKGLQVMVDWASNVTFANEEIDKERGVVREELRLRSDGNSRVFEKHAPIIWNNAKHATHFPGGDTSIVLNAPHETFRRFYKDWYRPELMAIIAVGDFKVSDIEDYIKDMFGQIPASVNPRPKADNSIKPFDGMKISIQTDKELTYPLILVSYNHPEPKAGSYGEFKNSITEAIATSMFNLRLQELTQKATPPFVQAGSSISASLGNVKSLDLQLLIKDDEFSFGWASLLTELFRAKNGGFTQPELDRVKKEILSSYEKIYNDREKTPSGSLAGELVRHFLKNEPSPGVEAEYKLIKQWANEITLTDVNKVFNDYISKDNISVAVSAPLKDGFEVPTAEEIQEIYTDLSGQEFEAYVDDSIDKELFDKEVKPGKVVKESENKKLGTTEWTLSNGATITIKKNDFKDQEILFSTYSFGGNSLYKDSEIINALTSDEVIDNSGVSEFNPTNLQKVLAGKNVGVSPYISDLTEGMNGSTTPQDLETFLQLVNLYFTEPRKDADAFQSFQTKQIDLLKKSQLDPSTAFRDTLRYAMSNYNVRNKPVTEETYRSIDLDRAYQIYKERFADASDFKFFFVGNVDLATLKPLVEKYLGSLPSSNSKEKFVDLKIGSLKGPIRKTVYKGKEPKSTVYLNIGGDFEYNLSNRYNINSLVSVLNVRLREELREEKGGVYGVGVYPQFTKYPSAKYSIIVSFGCDPERVEELVKAVKDVMKELQTSLASDDNMLKTTETQKRSYESDVKENRFWLNNLVSYNTNGENPADILNYLNLVSKLNKKDIQETAKKYLKINEMREFVLMPEK